MPSWEFILQLVAGLVIVSLFLWWRAAQNEADRLQSRVWNLEDRIQEIEPQLPPFQFRFEQGGLSMADFNRLTEWLDTQGDQAQWTGYIRNESHPSSHPSSHCREQGISIRSESKAFAMMFKLKFQGLLS